MQKERQSQPWVLLVPFLFLCSSVYSQVAISEFMAVNDTALQDEDGDSSDWIELYNSAPTNVNIGGWTLTDRSNDLARWSFPDTTLPAGGYLVVFASGKDRAVSGSELHTNFKLGGGGEYLSLVRADGHTIEHEYAPAYPEQYADISYGSTLGSTGVVFVAEGQACRALVPSGSVTDWETTAFDDRTWLAGSTGAGYERRPGDSDSYAALIGTDLEAAMYGVNAGAYVRVPFLVDVVPELAALTLGMKFDDGFVAYLNGHEIASSNAPAGPAWDSAASDGRDDEEALLYAAFPMADPRGLLESGTNVLAIHGLNTSDSSSDFLVLPRLEGWTPATNYGVSAVYMGNPTPGAANGAGFAGYVADTKFSTDRGFYTNAIQVGITTVTENASIYFTTDCSVPSASNGTLYVAPVAITNTTVLRAAAFRPGYRSTDVDTHTYIFPDDVLAQTGDGFPLPPDPSESDWSYEMDPDVVTDPRFAVELTNDLRALPVLSLSLPTQDLWGTNGIYANPESLGMAWERSASMELFTAGDGGVQENCGLRVQGGGSRYRNVGKKALRIAFRSQYGPTRLRHPFFEGRGAGEYDTITIRGNYFDSWTVHTAGGAESIGWLNALQLRDAFARHTHRAMHRHAIQDRWVHLYLNGLYWGVYNCTERPDEIFAEQYYGGLREHYDVLKQRPRGQPNGSAPEVVYGDLTAWNALMDLVESDTSSPAVYAQVEAAVDIDAFIDYVILNLWGGNQDWPHNNWYAVRNKVGGGTWAFIEWDAENFMYRLDESGKLNTSTDNSPGIIYSRLRLNEGFRTRFADRVQMHLFNGGALTYAACTNRLGTIAGSVRPAMNAESARWGDERGQNPPLNTIDNWDAVLGSKLTTYCEERGGIVLDQFRSIGLFPDTPAPVLYPRGGTVSRGETVSISGAGTVVYTLDGTDPREATTGTAVGTVYTGEVALARSALLKARALDGGDWSPLAQVTFALDEPSPLRITEIMYHPAPPRPGTAETNYLTSDFEFVEIQNTGSNTVGLAGVHFDTGILFEFSDSAVAVLAPGAYLVVVKNRDAFLARYPGVPPARVAGVFQGEYGVFEPRNLADGGERIRFRDGRGQAILSFEYDDWYAATDGEGHSLVPVDTAAPENMWDERTAWHVSSLIHGSPGTADSAAYPSPGTIVVNEVLAHQDRDDPGDWVELHNTTTQAVDISGWFLTDNPAALGKYAIPTGTVIAAGGFAVFNEFAHFGTNVLGTTNGFALSEGGETVFLSIPGGDGNPATVTDWQSFGASDNGVTIGRHVLSTGSSDFTALTTPSAGNTNAYPLVGPIVISEVMYHPATSGVYEFVELLNSGGAAFPLFDAVRGGWQLSGGVDYTFGAGATIPAGGFALVIPTNEAAFRQVYTNVPPGIPVYGPYTGRLDNAGETLRLLRPGDPDPVSGEIPLVLADRISYGDGAPWPEAADGGGAALERRSLSLYGNDPSSWIAGFDGGSPGRAQPRVVSGEISGTVVAGDAVLSFVPDVVWTNGAVTRVELLKDGEVIRSTDTPGETMVWTGRVSGASSTFELRIADNDGTHRSPAVRLAFPAVDAGGDRVVRLEDAARLSGQVMLDGEPWFSADAGWHVMSGQDVSFSDAGALTFAQFSVTGDHRLRFSVVDGGIVFSDEAVLTVVFGSAPNSIPYAEDFETYAAGTRLVGVGGWYAPAPNAAATVMAPYAWSSEYPIAVEHTRVVEFRDPVSNVFDKVQALTNVWLDMMLECVYWREPGPPAVKDGDRFALFINSNGHPVVWSRVVPGHPGSNGWTALSEVSLPEGDWFRLTVSADFERDPPAGRLWINSRAVTNAQTWFDFADTNRSGLHSIRAGGAFRMDDLVVDDYDVLSYRKITTSREGGGAVSPDGEILVPLHGTTNVAMTAANYHYIADVEIDGVSAGSIETVTFTNVVSRRYLHALFAPDLATNGVPEWWLAGHYGISNDFDAAALSDSDRDGLAAWEEWIAGTLPTNGESVLQLEIERGAGTMKLLYHAVSGRVYRLDYRDGLAASNAWHSLTGHVARATGRASNTDATPAPKRFYRLKVRVGE